MGSSLPETSSFRSERVEEGGLCCGKGGPSLQKATVAWDRPSRSVSLGSSVPGLAVEVTVPAEPVSMPMGKTAELSCSYSTSVGDNFALEWSFVQPGKPISASAPVS